MAWGPPKTPKQRAGYKEGRRGLGSAPYDHVDAESDSTDGEGGVDLDFRDPDPDTHVITPMRTIAMTNLVKTGVPMHVAASAIGIKATVWQSWCATARKHKDAGKVGGFELGQSPYLYWLEKVNEAKAQYEASLIATISQASQHDWKAAAWMLERFASKRWHLASKIEIEARHGNGKVDISALPTDALLKIAKGQVDQEAPKALTTGEPVDAELLDEDLKGE